jgi:hypothetical protein
VARVRSSRDRSLTREESVEHVFDVPVETVERWTFLPRLSIKDREDACQEYGRLVPL